MRRFYPNSRAVTDAPTARWTAQQRDHGTACMRVVVGGTPVMFDHGRVPPPADVAVRTA
jgi:hypothetical protein